MLRFTGSLLFVSSLAVQAVMAFPLHPTPAANIQVSPLIPSPTEHALIVVYDYTENGIQGIVKATNIQVMRFGNTFQIDATRGVLASDADRGLREATPQSSFETSGGELR